MPSHRTSTFWVIQERTSVRASSNKAGFSMVVLTTRYVGNKCDKSIKAVEARAWMGGGSAGVVLMLGLLAVAARSEPIGGGGAHPFVESDVHKGEAPGEEHEEQRGDFAA